jgi:hypothetical protein
MVALFALVGAVMLSGKLEPGTNAGIGAETVKQRFSAPIVFESTRTISRVHSDYFAPFTVKTSSGADYYLKLVDIFTQEVALTAYIRGGEMLTTRAPIGMFEMRYAVGSDWYGSTLLFGPNTSYFKAEKQFTFEYGDGSAKGYTIELIKQTGGNLRTRPMSGSQF